MTTTTRPRIAVIGATGQQGRSLIDALADRDIAIRALVRNPNSSAANELRDRGIEIEIEIVKADQEDAQSLTDGLADVDALFYMTTFEGPDGTEGEVRRGRTVADAATRAGVPHVVYSSVGGAERRTGIPHFDSKYEVEKRLSSAPSAMILRPTFFMENLTGQLTMEFYVHRRPWGPLAQSNRVREGSSRGLGDGTSCAAMSKQQPPSADLSANTEGASIARFAIRVTSTGEDRYPFSHYSPSSITSGSRSMSRAPSAND